MTWLDYKHLKSAVNINQVLGYYGIDLQRVGETHLKGTCPLPDHTGDRSNPNAFHVDTQKNAFNCFTHCGGGNVIDFVAKMESCDFRQAALKLHEEFLSDVSAPQETDDQGSGEKADQPNAVNDPLTFELKGLNAKHPFLRKTKGLTPDTIKTFGLGFCTKGLLAGWIAIPVHNNIGERVAYVGRSISSTQAESEGKYKFPPGFKKSLEIFNLYRVLQSRETIEKYGRIIVEGFFGAFWLHQCGFKNVVALMGKELSDQQAEQLLAASDRFTIFLDGGQPGCHAAKKVTSRLIHRAFVRVIRFPDGPKRKPAHLERQELKKLLTMQKPSL